MSAGSLPARGLSINQWPVTAGKRKVIVKHLFLPLLIIASIGTAAASLPVPVAIEPMAKTPFANQHDVLTTGDQYVYYMGADANLWQLYYTPSTNSWWAQDLCDAASSPPVQPGNGLTTFDNDLQGIERVVYLGSDLHIHLLSFNASTSVWTNLDITKAAKSVNALSTSSLAAFYDNNTTSPGELHVVFQGADLHIYQLSTISSGAWVEQNLSALTDNDQGSSGTPLVAQSDVLGDHIYWTGLNHHVFELSYLRGVYKWVDQDLSHITGSTGAAANSNLAVYVDSSGGQHVVYEGTNSHIYQLYYNEMTGSPIQWSNQDLTAQWGAPNAISGSGLAAYDTGYDIGGYDAQRIAFVGTNSDVYTLYFNASTHHWYWADLSSGLGLPTVTSGGKLTGYVFGDNFPNPDNESIIFDGARPNTSNFEILQLDSELGGPFAPEQLE